MPGHDLSRGALTGLKVVDLLRVLAGPLCTQMLADHGTINRLIPTSAFAADDKQNQRETKQ